MSLLGTLQVRLGLDTSTFSSRFNGFAKDIEKRASRFQRSLSGLSNLGAMIGGAGITASLMSGVKAAGEFEGVMLRVAGAADATSSEMSGLSDWILKQAEDSIYSATSMGQAAEELAKAGQSVAQITSGGLAGTLQLAAAEGLEMGEAALMITNTLGAFNLKASESASVADALAGAAAASQASVRGLGLSFQQSAANASLVGMSYQELAGFLALMAKNGIQGSDAGTSVKTMLLSLKKPAGEAADLMKRLGLNFTDAKGNFKDIATIGDILRKGLGKLTVAERQLALQKIFGTDAFRASAILYKDNEGALRGFIEAAKDTEAAEKLAQSRTTGFTAEMRKLGPAISSAFIDMTKKNGSLGWLTDGAKELRGFVTSLKDAPPWLTKLGIGLAASVSALPFFAAGLNTVASALPVLSRGLAIAFGPWGIAIAAATALAWVFRDDLGKVFNDIQTDWKAFNSEDNWMSGELKESWGELGQTFRKIGTDISGMFTTLKSESDKAKSDESTNGAWFATSWKEFFDTGAWHLNNTVVLFDILVQILAATAKNFPAVLQGVGDQISEIWRGIVEKIDKFGEDAADAMVAAGRKVIDSWKGLGWGDMGKFAAEGLKKGMTGAISSVSKAGGDLGDAAAKAAKESLLVESPSRVFYEIGQFVAQGFGLGIKDGTPAAQKHLQNLIGTMDSPLRAQAVTAEDIQKHQMGASFQQGAAQFESAWSIASRNVGNSIDELVQNGKFSFKELADSILKDFASQTLKKLMSGIFDGVMKLFSGAGGSGGGGGSWWSSLLSFDGGGYTGDGARTGGMDGKGGRLAMIHPRETVIDHTKVRNTANTGRGKGAITISMPVTLQPGVSREELARILPEFQKTVINTLVRGVERGGRLASVFGE